MIRRRELLQLCVAALGGNLLGSASMRTLAGESPTRIPSRTLFDGPTRALVAELAEMIIPTTDTPGAIAAGVPAFIEMMVADWHTETERGIFLEGLSALDAYAVTTFGQSFLGCSVEQRVEALQHAEQEASSYVSPMPGGLFGAMSKLVDEHTPFFAKLKELTVLGYFSSEVGAKQELAYNPMPMRFDGDYDFAAIGRHWSY